MIKKILLMPGEFHVSIVPTEISTVLGSCVSVCIWDTVKRIGGMNHYLLPGTEEDHAGEANRGLTSIKLLIRSMLNRRANLENLEAKIFGGCNSLYRTNDQFEVGKRNIEVAVELLREVNIPIVARHVGGHQGRKIYFDTGTGKVKMKLLSQNSHAFYEKIHKSFGY